MDLWCFWGWLKDKLLISPQVLNFNILAFAVEVWIKDNFHLNCSYRVLCIFYYACLFFPCTWFCKHRLTNLWEFFTRWWDGHLRNYFLWRKSYSSWLRERGRERKQSSVLLHQALVWKVSAPECSLIKFSLPFVFHNKLSAIFRSCWNRLPLRVAVTSKVRWMSLQHG